MTYTVQSAQQSLFDIAVEVYGDVQGAFWLLQDNTETLPGLTDRLQAGQVLQLRSDTLNARQTDYLSNFSPFQTIDEVDRPQGVGFWQLNEYTVT